ncbi:MAG: BMP family ABC transporter substrate-binding protein [Fimbriimonadaceae bacterium]|nr:BMP family ABC transporter substrate-binding protein [Fimbriimonadaceae bacterium]
MKVSALVGTAIGAMLLAGCGGPKDNASASNETPDGKPAAKQLVVGIVFDSGGRGDKSFNDSAWAGVERAQKDFGILERSVESKSEKDYEPNLEALAEQGADLVVGVGINMKAAMEKVAPKFKNTKFAIVDASVAADNVRSLLFKEEEGSFLAGYLAGLMTKTKKLGFVGGMELPLIKKFQAGYEAGAKTADKGVEVLPAKYTGSWDNVDYAKVAALSLINAGADIVYHAAGRAGLGVISAAKEKGVYAIGVDSDQDDIAEGSVLTSMIKRVDEAVYQTIKDLRDGAFTPGDKIYDLKAGGVGLSEMRFTKEAIGPEKLAQVQAISDKIASGELKVPSSAEELQTYLSGL